MIAAALTVLAALAWIWLDNPTPPPGRSATVRQQPVRRFPPPPPAAITFGLAVATRPAWADAAVHRPPPVWAWLARAALFLLPLLLLAALWLWLRARAPAWTRLGTDKVEDRLQNRLPASDDDGLFADATLRALAAALKGRSDLPSDRIDVRRTVEATAAHAGLLQVVWEPRPVESPVHVAIERRSREDHVGELYFRVADRLRALGAEVGVSQYRTDLGHRRDEDGRPLAAHRLDPWESKALLIAVGDGDALYDAAGRAPSAARLRPIEGWPRRVLLSVRPVMLWGDRERRLGDGVMAVAPATGRGIAGLAERLAGARPLRGLIGVRARTRDVAARR